MHSLSKEGGVPLSHIVTYNFVLPTQAFSVNAYRYRKNFTKTAEARAYETKILAMLEDHKELHDMADAFKEHGGFFHVEINCTYPHHIFYNGSGHISAKTLDVDNVVKPLLDLIFNEFMDVPDRFITKVTSSKSISSNYGIEVSIFLKS